LFSETFCGSKRVSAQETWLWLLSFIFPIVTKFKASPAGLLASLAVRETVCKCLKKQEGQAGISWAIWCKGTLGNFSFAGSRSNLANFAKT
jgi:hypothetical protein